MFRIHTHRIAAGLTAVAALLAVAPGAAADESQGPPPVPVRVSKAQLERMAPQVWVPGTVVSRNDARIAAEVAGRLVWVADIGDQVKQGAAIARIDDHALQLQLKNDEATITSLESSLAYIQQQVERLERLQEQQIVPPNDLEEMVSRLDTTSQQLVQAKVAREQTLYRLDHTTVKAPFSGRVVERLQQPGGYASVGLPLVRLVDTENVEVRAQAPLAVAPFVDEGMRVVVEERSQHAELPVRRVVRVGDELSRNFEIRVAVEGREPWMIGSAVRVALPSAAPQQVIAVPRDALVLRADSAYVYKVKDDDTVERVAVETGSGSSALIQVIGDLADGDRVVVRGGERLRPGQAVSIAAES